MNKISLTQTWPPPFVSVCTPTFNRRPFIPYMIKCFQQQDYPQDRLEWIIIDDGSDKIGELVSHIPQVKYFPYERKMLLGEKRNLLNAKASGEIIIYMDDDDYYPPERISHAVGRLLANPEAMCAGSSIMYIYFKTLDKIYKFGPYGPKHSTAATFAFRRDLLKDNKYDDSAAVSEERSFLNNYTIPFVQLDPFKSILVFAHDHNSVNKELLLANAHPDYIKETSLQVSEFIADSDIRDFYMNRLGDILKTYEAGRPESKPEMLKQIEEITKVREAEIERRRAGASAAAGAAMDMSGGITIKIGDDPPRFRSIKEIVQLLQDQHTHIIHLTSLLKGKDLEIELLIDAKRS
jgi:glycosyltransferase involved in cell wall biosynthesis